MSDSGQSKVEGRDTAPVDRPNLSKDYLAGTAQEEWVNLRPSEFFTDNHIDLMRDTRVTAIDVAARSVWRSYDTRLYGHLQ